jgi:hypothetical protein
MKKMEPSTKIQPNRFSFVKEHVKKSAFFVPFLKRNEKRPSLSHKLKKRKMNNIWNFAGIFFAIFCLTNPAQLRVKKCAKMTANKLQSKFSLLGSYCIKLKS